MITIARDFMCINPPERIDRRIAHKIFLLRHYIFGWIRGKNVGIFTLIWRHFHEAPKLRARLAFIKLKMVKRMVGWYKTEYDDFNDPVKRVADPSSPEPIPFPDDGNVFIDSHDMLFDRESYEKRQRERQKLVERIAGNPNSEV